MHECPESIVMHNQQFVCEPDKIVHAGFLIYFFFKNVQFIGIFASSIFAFKVSSLMDFPRIFLMP